MNTVKHEKLVNIIKEANDLIEFAFPIVEEEENVYKKGVLASYKKRMRLWIENLDLGELER